MRVFLVLTALLGASLFSSQAYCLGKKRLVEPQATPPVQNGNQNGKRVIEIFPITQVEIEMPDGSTHSFGQDFRETLKSRLDQSGRYIVTYPEVQPLGPTAARMRQAQPPLCEPYCWNYSSPAAGTLKVHVDAMSFQTGNRGEKTLYGFTERFRTPFNDGSMRYGNEFPLRTATFDPNWFDRTFDDKGTAPFDSRAGLDLGDGFRLDVLFAWLAVKYAKYDAELRLRLDLDSWAAGRHEETEIAVKGGGYFYDVSGGYEMYSGGIGIARKDAMEQALGKAISATYASVAHALDGLPLAARVDEISPDGQVMLGTGLDAGVSPGVYYQEIQHPEIIFQVVKSVTDGAIARLVRGDAKTVSVGDLLRSVPEIPKDVLGSARKLASLRASADPGRVLVAADNISLPAQNLPRSSQLKGWVPNENAFDAFLKSLSGVLTLPFRIVRYFSYDQSYRKHADPSSSDPAPDSGGTEKIWLARARTGAWAGQIGLTGAVDRPIDSALAPIVAVIDTGVDYNHPAIHDSLWLNPSPVGLGDGFQDRYGWDFISGDSRPYDDGYHGTEMASAVVAVSPGARIMALKAFSPYGVTTSAALYGAIRYAADHGADVILCAWATRRGSQALSEAVQYVTDRGAVVVAAAGDRGDDLDQAPSFPAAYARDSDRVVSVTDVDAADRLVAEPGKFANFGKDTVKLAAPGSSVELADPRAGYDRVTSSSVAAALAAGAIARELGFLRQEQKEAFAPDALDAVLSAAKRIPALETGVEGGRRLQITR